MPTINLEMMKQLLEEFSEKEALTTEEIAVIEKEVGALEQRIEFCRKKLTNFSQDKEKLEAMKNRYMSGNFTASITMNQTSTGPASIPSAKNQTNTADLNQSSSVETTKQKAKDNIVQPEVEKKSKPTAVEPSTDNQTLEATQKKSEEMATENEEAKSTEEAASNKEGGDTIKSINDALKGLFRK